MTCCKVNYAYHVTNILACDDAPAPPNWRHLKTTKAEAEDFDGPLFGLNGVFLTTTLRDSGLPTRTVYPREGRFRQSYWRVQVPLKRFSNARIFKVQEDDHNATKQVLLMIADNNYSDIINGVINYSGVEELTKKSNDYLHRNPKTKDWYSNNFDPEDPYWVNLFVPHRVRLGSDCEWDIVQHY